MTTLNQTRTKTGTRRDPNRGHVPDVLTQIKCAAANPLATGIGAVVGGVIPWFARTVAHHEVGERWWADPRALIVVGCMLFSVSTVYTFGRAAFRAPRKALGFVIALEGVAVLCSTPRVWMTALALLVLINAVTSGCTIALAHAETRRRSAASALGHARSWAARSARGTANGARTPVDDRRDGVVDAEVVAWHPGERGRRAVVRAITRQDQGN